MCTSSGIETNVEVKREHMKSMAVATLNFLGEATKSSALQAVEEAQVKVVGEWEPLEVIMDSGAHVSVGPRHVGAKAGYSVQESEGSKAGVCYTAANGGEIPNLGERLLAVITEEGTVRGMTQQVADVTKTLEAVRANLRSGHAVIFNDDGNGTGTGSFMVNKATGELNAIHDDGFNYIMRRWIIPAQEVPQIMTNMQGDPAAAMDFTRQAS